MFPNLFRVLASTIVANGRVESTYKYFFYQVFASV